MYKDKKITTDLACEILDQEIENYLHDRDEANQTIETLITMIDVSQESLHPHQISQVFRLISFINKIQLLQSHTSKAYI